ncbi:hypothetical protein MYCTH_94772 [Thermothelomyces thermophilus ATCC 42464]|uniref:Polyketide synthase dehydratase domain-containing protein n=1 Tax=Thermothelomyces thermophilus (strain ATCC 42464 / BCRC 31852 / DSM 1799) TaxID=573729 RepID=G2QFF6_THET4|nr:uncharacterized protein MYCTH_94772 [Thermothelomyces thermophilus ATCC 42464]AEO59185.1 hypothetical protein MYCTH_94772 [Thermothelomyces thermophilus ATCC 42464]
MYDCLAELGVVYYGPLFQGMSSCYASNTCAVGNVVVPAVVLDVAKEMLNGHLTDAVIQPALLESIIEMYCLLVGARRHAINTIYLPSSVDRATVSPAAERPNPGIITTLKAWRLSSSTKTPVSRVWWRCASCMHLLERAVPTITLHTFTWPICDPAKAPDMADGVLTIRSETAMRFATLDPDAKSQLPELETADAIVKVFNFVFGSDSSATGELEFMKRAGAFFTP